MGLVEQFEPLNYPFDEYLISNFGRIKRKRDGRIMKCGKTGKNGWDSERISKEYFDLMFAVSKNQLIFGGNYYTDILPPTAGWVVWDKRCDDKIRNDFADCEIAWCSVGVARVFRYLYNGFFEGSTKNRDERFHPTQKPTQLWGKLINYYTKEGDLIFDPFMGSFTTAVCCHRLQRHFLGAELNKEYFEKGQKRLKAEQNQISFFDLKKIENIRKNS